MNESVSIFEYFEPMYQNLYTLEAWVLWASVWILYIGYYICLCIAFIMLAIIIVVPFLSLKEFVNCGIKIQFGNKKHKQKLSEKMRDNYINRLKMVTKKKRNTNEYIRI